MKVNLETDKALNDIVLDVLGMEQITEERTVQFLKDSGNVIKKNTVALLRGMKSDKNHKHMADDVKVTISGRKTGATGVIVGGGKKTAYKWHLLDDGTHNPNGSVHTRPTHFTQKALKASEGQIDALMTTLEGEITNGH